MTPINYRDPNDILADMKRKDGPILGKDNLTQLNAELLIALSYKADETSRRAEKVSVVHLIIAITTALIAIITLWVSLQRCT